MVASREIIVQYWPALIVLISSIALGRFFCSWICPFGTTIDITDKLLARRRDGKKGRDGINERRRLYDGRLLKYYILAFLVLSLFFGGQMVGWLDPLSLANNAYTIIVHPYLVSVINNLFYFFYDIPFLDSLLKPVHEIFKTILFAFQPPFFRLHLVFLTVFIGIVSLGIAYRRYWCRNLCPLGALLALASDWALLKRIVNENCTSCRQCETRCGMGAIGDNGKGTLGGECTLCLTCQKVCQVGAVQFKRIQPVNQSVKIDLSRRRLLTAGLFSIASVPILNLNLSRVFGKNNPSVIRPPGAVTEERFTARCVRCGECMRICKTNGLHPVVFEDRLSNIWSPTLVPRLGYCDYGCALCGKVCPTGAIRGLELEEKQALVIGKAGINQGRCIPWVGLSRLPELKERWEDVNCGVCEEVCPIPTKAIRFDPYPVSQGKEIKRVFVVDDLCTGCGFCEKVCPVTGVAAITVEGIQPQLVNKRLMELGTAPPPEQPIAGLFPNAITTWNREAGPIIYRGSERLFEYIDGGADPYLSYSFIQVAVCNYLMENPRRGVKIDIWEFARTDDAYGVFSKDRTGTRVDIGDEGAIYENYLWIWKGRYFISIEPQEGQGDIMPEDVILLGKAIAASMPPAYRKTPLPPVVNLLPDDRLIRGSVKFFHQKIIMDNIYISDRYIEDNVFLLDEETDAVIGEYSVSGDQGAPSMKLMVVKYPDADIAKKAYQYVIDLRKGRGETLVTPYSGLEADSAQTFVDSAGQFSSVYQKDNILISTFFAPSRQDSERYINKVSGSKGGF